MTTLSTRPTSAPRVAVEQPASLLMHALQTALPVTFLELLLDRIEAAR